MGDLIGSHKTEATAMKKAKKEIKFKFSEREKRKDEILIWLDGENHRPAGALGHPDAAEGVRSLPGQGFLFVISEPQISG